MSELNIFFILDGSGSMMGVQDEVVKGLNAFIRDQKDETQISGEDTFFTLTVFDTSVATLYLAEDINDITDVTKKDTLRGGGTALYDAIGKTLTQVESEDLKGKKLVVIYTDGEENSSVEWDADKVKELIQSYQNQGDWTFLFMGSELAEWQARAAAMNLGLYQGNTVTTYGGSQGTTSTFAGMSTAARAHKANTVLQSTDFYEQYTNTNLRAAVKDTLEEDEDKEEQISEIDF